MSRFIYGALLLLCSVYVCKAAVNENQWNRFHALVDVEQRWKNGIVNFKLDKDLTAEQLELILKAMNKIETKSCVRFRPHQDAYGPDYVEIANSSTCASEDGRVQDGQTIELNEDCESQGEVINLLLHTVGMRSHQLRLDHKRHLTIHWDNIKDEFKNEYHPSAYPKYRGKFKFLTPFDEDSIMLTGPLAHSRNGEPTMTAKHSHTLTEIYEKDDLSENDAILLNRLYHCTPIRQRRPSYLFVKLEDTFLPENVNYQTFRSAFI